MKIAIYTRTALQDDMKINSQVESCKSILNNEDFNIYSDNGYSAHDKTRPAFQQMIKDIEDGKVEKVIVTDISRICRDSFAFLRFCDLTKAHGVSLVTLQQ